MAFGFGGENVGRAFVALHANGDDVPDDIGDALDKMTPKFREAGEEHSKAYSDWFERESKKNSRKSADAFLGGFRDELAKGIKDFDKTKDAAGQLEQGLKRLKVISEDNDRVTRHWMDRFHRQLVVINDDLDRSATRVGKLFGKGSRNDLLNVIGGAVEGLTRMVSLAPKAAEKLAGVFSGKGGAGGGGTDIVKIATQFATSIVGISIGLVALVTVAGAAATLVNGIAAALIGLVASAAFAVGAIGGVALALAGPLLLGVGVAALAIANLDKQTKKAFDGIGDSFSKLGDSAGKAIGPGLRQAAENLAPAVGKLEPLVDGIAEALGRVAVGWSEAVDSPDFIRFRNVLERFAPRAIESIGDAVGGIAGGIAGIFRAAIPITNEFLDWLVKITDQFSDWANSATGQSELRSFFDRAAESAKAIGGFLHDAIVATADLLDAGKDSGDTLFKKMADQLERFSNYITDPENQAAIGDFFANGIDVAEKLGNAILDISDALGELDTPESRNFLAFLFDGFGAVLRIIELVSEAFTKGRILFNRFVGAIVSGSASVGRAVGKIGKAVGGIGGFFTGAYQDARSVFSRMNSGAASTASAIGGFFRRMGSAIGGFFAGAAKDAQGAWSRINSGARQVVSAVTGFFGSLPGRVAGAVSGLASKVGSEFNKILEKVRDIPGQIVSMFSGLAGRILSAIGSIDIGSLIKIPDPGGGVPYVPGIATGGVFGKITSGPQLRWVGEDGPEAIVPLNRPLNQVDPSVRGLSAIAQGQGGRGTVDASGWTIVTTATDPYTAAREVVNDFAAKALF